MIRQRPVPTGTHIGQQWQIFICGCLQHSIAGQSDKVTKSSNTFQPLTMIFANHLLVPSKTIDFVDSMNVLCSLALNSNVSLVYQSDIFRSNQPICLKDCCFKLSQNFTELSSTCGLIDAYHMELVVVKMSRASVAVASLGQNKNSNYCFPQFSVFWSLPQPFWWKT